MVHTGWIHLDVTVRKFTWKRDMRTKWWDTGLILPCDIVCIFVDITDCCKYVWIVMTNACKHVTTIFDDSKDELNEQFQIMRAILFRHLIWSKLYIIYGSRSDIASRQCINISGCHSFEYNYHNQTGLNCWESIYFILHKLSNVWFPVTFIYCLISYTQGDYLNFNIEYFGVTIWHPFTIWHLFTNWHFFKDCHRYIELFACKEARITHNYLTIYFIHIASTKISD